MKKRKYTPQKLGIMAMFVAIGLVLQYIEGQFMLTSVPGGKLGLCNIVSIINIFLFGGKNALVIALLRASLGTIITSGVTALPYSIAGTFLSVLIMCATKKFLYPTVGMVGISVLGAAAHNTAQVFVAAIILKSGYVFSYTPFLLLVAVVSGTVTGIGAHIIGKRILKYGDRI